MIWRSDHRVIENDVTVESIINMCHPELAPTAIEEPYDACGITTNVIRTQSTLRAFQMGPVLLHS